MDKYKFGEFIYNNRKKQGLTQEELGRRLKVTNKAVSKWETGETLPDILLLEPLAKELHVTIDELLTLQKPEVEKVIVKPKAFPYIIMGVALIVLSIVVSILTFKIYDMKHETITVENATEYYQINCCDKVSLNGYDITIEGHFEEIVDVINPSLTIEINIQYFYLNNSDKVCEILYFGRTQTYDPNNPTFEITVSPKNSISDYKAFYGTKVTYTIIDAKGEVINEKK